MTICSPLEKSRIVLHDCTRAKPYNFFLFSVNGVVLKYFGSEICLTPKNLGPGSMRVWMYCFIKYECKSKCECEAIAIQNVNVVMNECECIGPSNLNVPVCIFFNV